jgi:3-deoxy-D-manno-octulosonic acid (KDO) 8-phosphate synthase
MEALTLDTASQSKITRSLGIPFIYKSSTRPIAVRQSYRGLGGLAILARYGNRRHSGLTDVHEAEDRRRPRGRDVLKPAFLCRRRLLHAVVAAGAGELKKGSSLAARHEERRDKARSQRQGSRIWQDAACLSVK